MSSIWATPLQIADTDDCHFYHCMDLPGHGFVQGQWDLRDCVDRYLGSVPMRGKRVLELGTASGFLCFEMERRGAEVVCLDVSPRQMGDIVPHSSWDIPVLVREGQEGIRRFNNAYWFAHAAMNSQAKLVHSTVYDIPDEIGPVDIVTLGCLLEHLRDPFRALQEASRFARETILVTGVVSRRHFPLYLLSGLGFAVKGFLPNHRNPGGYFSWWALTPGYIRNALGVLGFTENRTRYFRATINGRSTWMFTVVSRRTGGESALVAHPGEVSRP